MQYRRRIFLFGSLGAVIAVIVALSFWFRQILPGSPSTHARGPINALAVVTLYGDVDDQASRSVALVLKLLSQTFPLDLRIEYRHATPRGLRRFVHGVRDERGSSAARLECAGLQGIFWKTLHALAQRTQLPALEDACLSRRDIASIIEADRTEARSRGLGNPPQVLINGKRLDPPFDFEHLRDVVTAYLATQDTRQYLPVISARDLWERQNEDRTLAIIDVRDALTFLQGHLVGAVNAPIEMLKGDSDSARKIFESFSSQLILVVDEPQQPAVDELRGRKAEGYAVMRFEGMEAADKIPALFVPEIP